jgi:hypothetical protein
MNHSAFEGVESRVEVVRPELSYSFNPGAAIFARSDADPRSLLEGGVGVTIQYVELNYWSTGQVSQQ